MVLTADWSKLKRGTMDLPRRQFLQFAVAGVALGAITSAARCQSYPTRPVRWVVPYPAGGPTDIIARLLGPWLSDRLGQQFVIENRPGATGNVGTEVVLRAPADGYTLLSVGTPHAINASLFEKLSFDVLRDIEPVIGIIRTPLVLLLHPSVPAKTVPEFITYVKANRGKISVASAGSGTPQHVSGELFKMMAGIDMTHVPFRGSAPALTGLLGGQVQCMFDTTPASIEHIRAGTLRALAVTTSARAEALPDVPTVSDALPGFEASAWYGLGVAKNTPVEVIATLNKEINAGLADPKIRARFADLGGSVLAGSPAAFGKLIADETEKWAKVVKFSGAKPE
jgi:tripartite-type tricarboxylate transporter receptor subunit TctC